MVAGIRIYVEGGGDQPKGKIELRDGLSQLLSCLRQQANSRNISWKIIPGGSRRLAYEDFLQALQDHPESFNVLLVDAAEKVEEGISPWDHLQSRDGWSKPDAGDEQCHLMVQVMESWFLADKESLQRYFGARFIGKHIPERANIETIAKQDVYKKLEAATRQRKRRGEKKSGYLEGRDGGKLLALVNPERIYRKSFHFRRFWEALAKVLAYNGPVTKSQN